MLIQDVCARGFHQTSYDSPHAGANTLFTVSTPLPPVPECAMFVPAYDAGVDVKSQCFRVNWSMLQEAVDAQTRYDSSAVGSSLWEKYESE
jgi:hypothetical protein